MNDENKIIIYQVFTRLFGNNNNHCVYNGDIATNGCGKMADFTLKALGEIKKLGATHIWYTGIIEHATQTDYRRYNISPDHPAIVKGKAGSPYAIKDYYDVDPDLANDVQGRMKEFENLVHRTHRTGLKVIIDFVPNHVARQYHSDAQPDGTTELGANDDSSQSFSPYNNFYYIPQAELHAQFDMKDGAAEPYREFPAKATGNNRFDATPNITDWYETVKLNYGVDYQNGGTCHFSPTAPAAMSLRARSTCCPISPCVRQTSARRTILRWAVSRPVRCWPSSSTARTSAKSISAPMATGSVSSVPRASALCWRASMKFPVRQRPSERTGTSRWYASGSCRRTGSMRPTTRRRRNGGTI